MGRHTNEKPLEPEKKEVEPEIEAPKPVERKPIDTLKRPSFDSPCVALEPIISSSFKKQMDQLDLTKPSVVASDGSIAIGTSCKRGGCNASYTSASDDSICVHHPGIPVFHEGYKFWSCCKKKTSDFTTFLGQVGCETGKHKWIQEESTDITCRWDWHQTPATVVVVVYAKNYDYKRSFVKINPVRLIVKLVFPQQGNAEFNIDLELRGVIDVSKASANMFGTKLEISMPKAEGGHWTMLDFPRETTREEIEQQHAIKSETREVISKVAGAEIAIDENDSDVDLDDLEVHEGAMITELGELARTCTLVEES